MFLLQTTCAVNGIRWSIQLHGRKEQMFCSPRHFWVIKALYCKMFFIVTSVSFMHTRIFGLLVPLLLRILSVSLHRHKSTLSPRLSIQKTHLSQFIGMCKLINWHFVPLDAFSCCRFAAVRSFSNHHQFSIKEWQLCRTIICLLFPRRPCHRLVI